MRRIGSNIRKQNSDEKANRLTRNIIRYTSKESPKNDYPKRIISPPKPSACCTDDNREKVGNAREVEGFKFEYRICKKCGHAVRFFYPAVSTTSTAVKEYRQWKRYLAQ
ncbi:MAG: hypothetical protein JSU66_06095 [Deltaproteobacteria bacterium]|nr:MAG: hypothetical protein JSU66_06095 [Deltaproteobacteria bacterium]